MASDVYSPGLFGVVAGETGVSSLGGGLRLRGYAIEELAENASFMEVAYLLLHEELPTSEELADFLSILIEAEELPPLVSELLERLPLHVDLMEILRSGVSLIGHFDLHADGDDAGAHVVKTQRLLAVLPLLISYRWRLANGLSRVQSDPQLGFAANLFRLIHNREPSELEDRALDVTLTLHAEHELTPSTFAARVVASTATDYYSAITAAIGAAKGAFHGAPNPEVIQTIQRAGDPESARKWVLEALRSGQRIMGFGRRVQKSPDSRAEVLTPLCRQLAVARGLEQFEATALAIELTLSEELGILPNLIWPASRVFHYLQFQPELYRPLFLVRRVTGWSAHIIEQLENNHVFRPRARYIGMSQRQVSRNRR